MKADLFARLNGFMIQLPPLRERPNDLYYLIKSYNFDIYKTFKYFSHEPQIQRHAFNSLLNYHWPQNLRELHKSMESAHVHLIKACMGHFSQKNLIIKDQQIEILFQQIQDVFVAKENIVSAQIKVPTNLVENHEISKYLIQELSSEYGHFILSQEHFHLQQVNHKTNSLSPIQSAAKEWQDFLKVNIDEIENLKDIQSHQSDLSNVELFMIFDSLPDGSLYPDNDPQFGIKVFSTVISQFGNDSDLLVNKLWSVLKINEDSQSKSSPSQKVYANVLKYRVQEEQLKYDIHQYFSNFPRYDDVDQPQIEFLAKDTLRIDSKGRIECFFQQNQSTHRYILHSNEEVDFSKIEFLLVEQLFEEEQLVFYLYGEFHNQKNIIGPLPVLQSVKEEFLMKVLDEFEEEKRQLILKSPKKSLKVYNEPYLGFFDLVEKVYYNAKKQDFFFKLSKTPQESPSLQKTLFYLSYKIS